MKKFDTLWGDLRRMPGPMVQEYTELEYVFNLMKGCGSYLEVGTAEGKSLYALSHTLSPDADITYIDLGEKHTEAKRKIVLDQLKDRKITEILGNSNTYSTYEGVKDKKFEVVLIDAGHDLINVLIDACWYGPLATKYLLFHDIKLPDVDKVFSWYAKHKPNKFVSRVVNSESFGFGVIGI